MNTPSTSLPGPSSHPVSVAHMNAPANWSEPVQTPEFGEITVVLRGTVLVDHDDGRLEVGEGQAVVTLAGERVRTDRGRRCGVRRGMPARVQPGGGPP